MRLANDAVSKCMDLLGISTARQPYRNGRECVRKWAMGEQWTPEMRDAQQSAIRERARPRKRVAYYARARLGLPEVDLISSRGTQ